MRHWLTIPAIGASALLALAYLASPLVSAHQLRSAVEGRDTVTVARMVEWPSLRTSLRRSIARDANLLPIARDVARTVRPTWWQRIRSLFGHSMLDRFIENYITPEGLSKLYHAKERWHATRGGRRLTTAKPALVAATGEGERGLKLARADAGGWLRALLPQETLAALRRIRRAEFVSPFRFVLDIRDRHKADRLIKSTFQLSNIGWTGFVWKLVAVEIRTVPGAKPGTTPGTKRGTPSRPAANPPATARHRRPLSRLNGFAAPPAAPNRLRLARLNGFKR